MDGDTAPYLSLFVCLYGKCIRNGLGRIGTNNRHSPDFRLLYDV